MILYKADFAESYRDGKDASERREIYNRIYKERAVPRFIEVSGWPHIAIITPDEKVLFSESERSIKDPRDFVKKYEKIIEDAK